MKKLNAAACVLTALLPAVAAAEEDWWREFKKFFYSDNPFDPTFTQNLWALVKETWWEILVAVLLIAAVIVFSCLRKKQQKAATAETTAENVTPEAEKEEK